MKTKPLQARFFWLVPVTVLLVASLATGSPLETSTSQTGTPAASYTGEPVSLKLLNASLVDFFRVISELSGLNVLIDPVHLQQILWNLIKNAAQAIQGKGKIVITLSSPRNQRIYLTIEDNGQGIDPGDARHIFDPFFTTKSDGTGLGLSIIHRLIETYEGLIDFNSIPGKGTVFTIIFKPAAPVEDRTKS